MKVLFMTVQKDLPIGSAECRDIERECNVTITPLDSLNANKNLYSIEFAERETNEHVSTALHLLADL